LIYILDLDDVEYPATGAEEKMINEKDAVRHLFFVFID